MHSYARRQSVEGRARDSACRAAGQIGESAHLGPRRSAKDRQTDTSSGAVHWRQETATHLLSAGARLRWDCLWETIHPYGQEGRVSVYRVTDLIGTSTQSWEDAASVAIKKASGTLRDIRVAEVVAQDIHIAEDGGITYRTKLRVSFKYEAGE